MFRRPLGLVLAGGGSFGCWQTAAVVELVRQGVVFDAALGVSAGALTATAYCLDRLDETLERWRGAERMRLLRLKPRLKPLTLCSADALWDWVGRNVPDEASRRRARCRLVVVSSCPTEKRSVYAVFDRAAGRWDGPLGRHLVASCSIPTIFPPVEAPYQGRTLTLVDGGVPGAEPFSFSELAHCKDVIVAQMPGLRKSVLQRLNEGRKRGRNQMSEGMASLRALPEPPRIFELVPSQPLGFEPLSFRAEHIARGLALGAADAGRFLEAVRLRDVGGRAA